MSDFVHLRVYSSYSLLLSTVKVSAIVKYAKKFGMSAVALTDCFNMFGALEFAVNAVDNKIQPIMGLTIRLVYGDESYSLVLLAQSQMGYKNIIKLSSATYESPVSQVSIDILEQHSADIIVLAGGMDGIASQTSLYGKRQVVEKLLAIFGDRLYIEVQRYKNWRDKSLEYYLLDLAYELSIPIVATNSIYFQSEEMFEAHDAMLCIANGRHVADESRHRSHADFYFKSAEEMCELFSDLPECIENTRLIAKRCAFAPGSRAPALPRLALENFANEAEAMRHYAYDGLSRKALFCPLEKYHERLEFELDVIAKMGYSGYFLIVADFINWGRNNGVSVGPGRGSGAGSLIAWTLGITDIDPLRFGLLFERFLNPERVSMPDFDIDFCQETRGKIIEYVFRRYGHGTVAQIITFGKLQARAVLRDVGRVLGMPYGVVNQICRMIPHNASNPITLEEAFKLDVNLRKEYDEDISVKKLIDISLQLEGLYRHASVHAAGIIISDGPIEEHMALYYDHKHGEVLPISQYSMKYVEMAGFVKFDFLGLKTITQINKTVMSVKKYQGIDIDISTIPLDDKLTFDMLSNGSTAGVFQLEGGTSVKALKQLKPDCIEDIIALISLNRPGPMENIQVYIARKHGIEPPDYMHPILEEVLKETFGVIVYQEQVMNIARVMSGYSLGAADLLRRAMGKKIPTEMAEQRAIFVEGAEKNGVDTRKANEIFDLVDKFAGYGFNKSHAAAYAVISYRTAWLRANYEVEFFIACLDLDIHDTDKVAYFIHEARKAGITILPPDINKSQKYFSKEGARVIRYGLLGCRNVGSSAAEEIILQRGSEPYKDITDFINRVNTKIVNKKAMEGLISVGTFDSIHSNRKQLFDSTPHLLRWAATSSARYQQFDMFGADSQVSLVETKDWHGSDKLANEFDIFGFYLTGHPLSSVECMYGIFHACTISSMNHDNHLLLVVINSVTIKSNKRGRFAVLSVSDPSAAAMTISVYGKELEKYSEILVEKQSIFISVRRVTDEEGGVRIFATNIETFDSYVNARVNSSIQLSVSHDFDYMAIAAILKDAPPGNFSLRISYPVDNGAMLISMPKKYFMRKEELDIIKDIHGVLDMQIL